MKSKIREMLFRGFEPCSDGYCVIGGKAKGMHTNGGCKCITNLSRAQLQILGSRLQVIGEKEIEIQQRGLGNEE
jgi:hypothetical protein